MTYGLAASVILLLITFSQYVTLRLENGHLKKQLNDHLKTNAEALREIESKLEAQISLFKTCSKEQDSCKTQLEKVRAKATEQERTINDQKSDLHENDVTTKDLRNQLSRKTLEISKMKAMQDDLRQEKEALEGTLKKCEEEKKDLKTKPSEKDNISDKKVATTPSMKKPSLIFDRDDMKIPDKKDGKINDDDDDDAGELESIFDDPPSKKEILHAELPDVNPNKIKVKKNDMTGNKYHKDENGQYLPIIVNDPPNAKRAKPKHSVLMENEKNTR